MSLSFVREGLDSNVNAPDVNQFSIITELLGTPPDDVIATIASENVSVCIQAPIAFAERSFSIGIDSEIRQEPAEA